MWIHEKDKVEYKNEKFKVASITGLYSSGPVKISITNKNKTLSFSLLEFNDLHTKGEVSVKSPRPKHRGY